MAYSVITISGNITRDPETIELKDGRRGIKFGVAVNKSKEVVVFYDVLFTEAGLVERLDKYAKKGSMITFSGDHSKAKVDDKIYENIYGTAIYELFSRSDENAIADKKTIATVHRELLHGTGPATPPPPANTAFVPDDDDLPF